MTIREFIPLLAHEELPPGYKLWRADSEGRVWARREHPAIRAVPKDVDGPADVEIISSDDDDPADDLLDDTEDDQ